MISDQPKCIAEISSDFRWTVLKSLVNIEKLVELSLKPACPPYYWGFHRGADGLGDFFPVLCDTSGFLSDCPPAGLQKIFFDFLILHPGYF